MYQVFHQTGEVGRQFWPGSRLCRRDSSAHESSNDRHSWPQLADELYETQPAPGPRPLREQPGAARPVEERDTGRIATAGHDRAWQEPPPWDAAPEEQVQLPRAYFQWEDTGCCCGPRKVPLVRRAERSREHC